MKTIACDVVVLPNDELTNKVIKASNMIKGGLFKLKDGTIFPHCSLYMLQLGDHDIDSVAGLLSIVANETVIMNLSAKTFGHYDGYVDIEYEKTNLLTNLQSGVVNALNPIRKGMRKNDILRLKNASGLVKRNLEHYGYRSIGKLFRPHITLTKFENANLMNPDLLPDLKRFDGIFNRIALFEMGDFGTCVRKIHEFSLKLNV